MTSRQYQHILLSKTLHTRQVFKMYNLKVSCRCVILKNMQIIAREVRNYITPEGRNPFRQWLTQLRDKRARANIQTRIARLQEGNFGDCKRLGSDLNEWEQ